MHQIFFIWLFHHQWSFRKLLMLKICKALRFGVSLQCIKLLFPSVGPSKLRWLQSVAPRNLLISLLLPNRMNYSASYGQLCSVVSTAAWLIWMVKQSINFLLAVIYIYQIRYLALPTILLIAKYLHINCTSYGIIVFEFLFK